MLHTYIILDKDGEVMYEYKKKFGNVYSAHVKQHSLWDDVWDSVFSYGEPTLDSNANARC